MLPRLRPGTTSELGAAVKASMGKAQNASLTSESMKEKYEVV
jgi:hypothetical protein